MLPTRMMPCELIIIEDLKGILLVIDETSLVMMFCLPHLPHLLHKIKADMPTNGLVRVLCNRLLAYIRIGTARTVKACNLVPLVANIMCRKFTKDIADKPDEMELRKFERYIPIYRYQLPFLEFRI